MKKLAFIICALMVFSLLIVACDNGTNNAGNAGDKAVEDVKEGANDVKDDIEDAVDNDGLDKENGIDDNRGEELKGSAQGYGGEVTVTVRVDGDDIISVEAVGEKETEGVGSKALDELPARIEEADSTDVDGVSGATKTSDAIKEAVNNALGK